MSFTVAEIARQVGGEVSGDASIQLKGVSPVESAAADDLTFAENEIYFERASKSAASAILLQAGIGADSAKKTLIRVPNARMAVARILALFFPPATFPSAIHPTAIVSMTAVVDPTAHVGPYCVIGERARIGPRAVLQAGDYVG